MKVAFFHLVGANVSGEHPAHVLQVALEILGMGDVLEGAGEPVLFGITDQGAEGPVDLSNGRRATRGPRRWAPARTPREAFLALAQRVFAAACAR